MKDKIETLEQIRVRVNKEVDRVQARIDKRLTEFCCESLKHFCKDGLFDVNTKRWGDNRISANVAHRTGPLAGQHDVFAFPFCPFCGKRR